MKVYESTVGYTYDPPVSSALLSAIRNHKYIRGSLVVTKEDKREPWFCVYVFDENNNLIGSSSLDFFYHEEFIDGDKGPIYLDKDLSDLREKLYTLI